MPSHTHFTLVHCLQVVTEWSDGELPLVLEALERMSHHLTAAVVSNDVNFVQHVLGHTVNGTTYCGTRARTTGEYGDWAQGGGRRGLIGSEAGVGACGSSSG